MESLNWNDYDQTVSQATGVREDNKRRTRQLIEESAVALFAERGYDNVTMAEIAWRADVSAATVFNHFATKDALIFLGLQRFECELLDAIRVRPASDSLPQAFRAFVLAVNGSLTSAAPDAMHRLRTIAEIIESSPALLARELVAALTRDSFYFVRQTGSHQRYRHADGRRVTVAPHAGGDTFTIKTLKSMIELQARWTEEDLKRLKLIR